jgi:hypothetical protein
MLFLYRPRQTWMPYYLPRSRTEQGAYNRRLQARFDATRRVAPPAPTDAARPSAERDIVGELKDLAALRSSGSLSDEEFDAVKARILGDAEAGS